MVAGVALKLICGGANKEMTADVETVGSATLVAVTVTVEKTRIVEGAV
jgi:hypothetical protein